MKASTIRGIHSILSGAFAAAQRWEWTDRNPAESAKPPTTIRQPIPATSPEDVAKMITEAGGRNVSLGLYLWLVVVTGVRRGELCSLQIRDFDLDRGLVHVAAGGFGALIRHAPHLPGHGAAGEQPEAMPSPDPPPLEPAGSPPPDEVLDLLYRSGEPRDLGATARQWLDLAAMGASVPEGFRAAGRGGLGDLLDAMTRGTNVARTDARLHVSGPDRYRLDFSRRQGRIDSTTIACDGERRWRVFQDRTMVGPAAPLRDHIAFLADSCWLLRARPSGGAELTYRGRPARQFRVTPGPGGEEVNRGPLMTFPTISLPHTQHDQRVAALLTRAPSDIGQAGRSV